MMAQQNKHAPGSPGDLKWQKKKQEGQKAADEAKATFEARKGGKK